MNVLVVGAAGGRGSLYMRCVDEREDLCLSGVVRNRRNPDLSGLSKQPTLYDSLDQALKDRVWDVAILSVPHALHDQMVRSLIAARVRVIVKEKPLARNLEQVACYRSLVADHTAIMTTTQRMVQGSFLRGKELLGRLGALRSFAYRYHFALPHMTRGWRAQKEQALGGVVLDMGYHALEVLQFYFGSPKQIQAEFAYLYSATAEQELEDRADIQLTYEHGLRGTLSLNRHAAKKEELFVIEGERGSLRIGSKRVTFLGFGIERLERREFSADKMQQIQRLFDRFLCAKFGLWREESFRRNRDVVAVVEQIYRSARVVTSHGSAVLPPAAVEGVGDLAK